MSTIESYVLRCIVSGVEHTVDDFTAHLEQCEECNQLYHELLQVYQTLYEQLHAPVNHKTFRLVKEIEGDNVIIAGILLKPQLLDEEPGKRHFTSEILLNTYQSDDVNVGELNNISLNRDEVLVRAVQSTSTQETTLFLFSNDRRLYDNVIFALPTLRMYFKSDGKGKVDIGQVDIASFDQLEVMISTNLQ
ncbi:hypothetical protein JW960_18580 [candidate division KSB1 bacterium]|nr:hypothetical protein [candidate division KSB1 bacterium]